MRIRLLLPVTALLIFAAPAAAGADVRGELSQLAGGAGCFGSTSAEGCATGVGVGAPESVLVSPDGAHAYVSQYNTTGVGDAALLAFRRDPVNGALTQLAGAQGCYDTDAAAGCTDGRAIGSGDGQGLAISRDGRFLYAASQQWNGITVFSRDPASGALTQLPGPAGCLTSSGDDDAGDPVCTDTRGTLLLNALTLTPNGRFLVASAYGEPNSLSVYSRDPATGALTQLPGADGCLSQDGTSEDGADTCTDIHDAGSTSSFAIAPDGRHLYVPVYGGGGAGAVGIFDMDPVTGRITQKGGTAGCISHDGSGQEDPNACTEVRAVAGPYAAAVTPDGKWLHIGAYDENGVAAFALHPDTGAPNQTAQACVTANGTSTDGAGTCADARGLDRVYTLTPSPDGANLYVTSDPEVGPSTDGMLAAFAVDPSNGALTQLPGAAGCVTEDGLSEGQPCKDGRRVGYYSAALSPDGGSLHLSSFEGEAVTTFARQAAPVCTSFARTVPFAGRLTAPLPCRDPNGDPVTVSLLIPPSRGTATLSGSNVTYRAPKAFTGQTVFTFNAADALGSGPPALAALEVDKRPGISAVKMASPFAVAPGRTPVSAKVRLGTKVRFRLSEAAKVRLTVQRPRPGRRAGGKCRKPTRKNSSKRPCTRWVKAGKVLRRNGKRGRNSVKFTGRIGRKALAPGRYRIELNAIDAVGSKAKPKRRKFRVLRRPKR